jgi:ATP-binding cassette subfamily G (WHITE) protein 2
MCNGHCVYHGSTNDVVPYFSRYGYPCEPHDNPADYALDVLIDISRKPVILTMLRNEYIATHADSLNLLHQQGNSIDNEYLERERRKYKVEAARSLTAEFFYLSQRTLRNVVRNPALAFSQVIVGIIMGLLVGLLFYKLEKSYDPGVQNRLGAIFFIVISQMFSSVTALEALLKERVLFIHVSLFHVIRYTYFNLISSIRNMQVVITEYSHILLLN